MIPKSLSASSLAIWESCPARWTAEYITGVRRGGSDAAELGHVLHSTLEEYVRRVYLDSKHTPSMAMLENILRVEYIKSFDTDLTNPRYAAAVRMIDDWYARSADEFVDRTVLLLEDKRSFDLPTSAGPITFNYIFDRLDRLDEPGVYEVVDYKSGMWRLNPADLRDRPQARIYALAAQLMFPDAKKIWVKFDQLRHDAVGIVFTAEENKATWDYLIRKAEEIIATDPDQPIPEYVNAECRWCVRKHDCESLGAAVDVTGVIALGDPMVLAHKRMDLDARARALGDSIKEIDELMLKLAEHDDVELWENNEFSVRITRGGRREVTDEEALRLIIGPEMIAKYGSIGVTMLDKVLKDPDLDQQVAINIRGYIGYKVGEAKIKVDPKNPID